MEVLSDLVDTYRIQKKTARRRRIGSEGRSIRERWKIESVRRGMDIPGAGDIMGTALAELETVDCSTGAMFDCPTSLIAVRQKLS